jgi:hypothetical protein
VQALPVKSQQEQTPAFLQNSKVKVHHRHENQVLYNKKEKTSKGDEHDLT